MIVFLIVFNSSDIDNILRNNGIYNIVFIEGITDAYLCHSLLGKLIDIECLFIIIKCVCIRDIEKDHLRYKTFGQALYIS